MNFGVDRETGDDPVSTPHFLKVLMSPLNGSECCYVRIKVKKECLIFLQNKDYQYFICLLRRYKKEFVVKIFAFCLLPQGIYLVAWARNMSDLSGFLERIRRIYQSYLSFRDQRAKRSWQMRVTFFKGDEMLFNCIKSVEFKPVHANLVLNPVQYPWSSCRYRVLFNQDNVFDK